VTVVLAAAVLVVDSTVSVVAEVVIVGLAAGPEVVAIMAAAIIVIVAMGVDTIVAEAEDSVVAGVVDVEEVEAESVINSKTMALALSATAAVIPTTQQITEISLTGAKRQSHKVSIIFPRSYLLRRSNL